jgi:adenylate cyclase
LRHAVSFSFETYIPSPMGLQLVAASGGAVYELRSGSAYLIGRAVHCDISIADPTLSREHATLTVGEDSVLVRDLASLNGTYINGARITEQSAVARDTVTFGKLTFSVANATESRASVPAAEADTPSITIVKQLSVRKNSGELAEALQQARVSGDQPAASAPGHSVEQKLATLLEVSKGLSKAVEVDALLDTIAGYAVQVLGADRATIELLDTDGALVPKISRDATGRRPPSAPPQSIARRALQDKAAVLTDDALGDARFGGDSIIAQKVQSAMCVPLLGNDDDPFGVLYVDNTSTQKQFSEADLEFIVAFAGIAGVAIENSRFAERIRHEAIVRSNFERFFTPQLAARIATSPDALRLGGEKRRVAVLFSDIRGFTPLAESMNPDAIARLVSEYFTEMVDCVFQYGGTLDKFIGDSVLAQWGAPIGTAEDADRAVAAAMAMMRSLQRLNARWREDGRPELAIGIGLNYGEAFAGNIGSERRLEYTIIGHTVNTAHRLCGEAGPGEILVSDIFRQALSQGMQYPPAIERVVGLELRGKTHPVPVYRVAW